MVPTYLFRAEVDLEQHSLAVKEFCKQQAEPKFCIWAKRYSSCGCSLISNREKSTLKLKSSASHSGNTLFLIWI